MNVLMRRGFGERADKEVGLVSVLMRRWVW